MQSTKYDKVNHYNNYKHISQLYKLTQASPTPSKQKTPLAKLPSLKCTNKSLSTQSSTGQLDSPNESVLTSYADSSYSPMRADQYAQVAAAQMPVQQHYSAGRGVYDKVDKYKTEICKNVQLRGVCKWGDQCFFAHSKDELQSKMPYNHYYKTKVCKHYNTTGFCPYANRCQYFHIKSHQVFSELLDCFEKKVNIKMMERETALECILGGTERVQKRLPIFKSIAGGNDGLSFQEKCLENIF